MAAVTGSYPGRSEAIPGRKRSRIPTTGGQASPGADRRTIAIGRIEPPTGDGGYRAIGRVEASSAARGGPGFGFILLPATDRRFNAAGRIVNPTGNGGIGSRDFVDPSGDQPAIGAITVEIAQN